MVVLFAYVEVALPLRKVLGCPAAFPVSFEVHSLGQVRKALLVGLALMTSSAEVVVPLERMAHVPEASSD